MPPSDVATQAAKIFEATLNKSVTEAINKYFEGKIMVTHPDSDHISYEVSLIGDASGVESKGGHLPRDPGVDPNVRQPPVDFPDAVEDTRPPPSKTKRGKR